MLTQRQYDRVLKYAALSTGAVLLVCCAALRADGQDPATGASQSPIQRETVKPVVLEPGISSAAVAAELALKGRQHKSPLLLLAAAEILGGLRDSPRSTQEIARTTTGPAPKEGEPLPFTVRGLVDLAREYAAGDEALQKLVDARAEQLSTRGLVKTPEAEELPTVTMDDESERLTFKAIDNGTIGPGQRIELSEIAFEAELPAILLVLGDGLGDIDLWVYDQASGALVGGHTGPTSRCFVAWTPKDQMTVKVVLTNSGEEADNYLLLANWD